MNDVLSVLVFENTVRDYLVSLTVLAGGMAAVWAVKVFVVHRLKVRAVRTETTIDDFLVHIIENKVMLLAFFGVFYLSVQNLVLPPAAGRAIDVIGVAVLAVMGIRLLVALVYYSFDTFLLKGEEEELRKANVRRLLPLVKVVLWGVGIVFFLDNLGFEISAVVAGLGIGGIAVALAAQAVLGDLFSYFSIMLDRPFELGDFIIVDDFMGTVEHIGIKTTRIRSLGGEQLVFSNTDLTGSRLKNYKRMEQRRVVFRFGVVYQSTLEQMREVPAMVRGIIEGIEGATVDRVHFFEFGDFSLNFEVVYYVASRDYNLYMDIQQRLNLAMMEEFKKKGIEFAYPTQTLFMERGGEA